MGTKLRVILVSLTILLLVSLSVNVLFFYKLLSQKASDNSIAVKEFKCSNAERFPGFDHNTVVFSAVPFTPPPTSSFAPVASSTPAYINFITVVFDKNIAGPGNLNCRITELPIIFTPKINGVFEWTKENTLTFRPASPLPAGAVFKANLTGYVEKLSGKTLRDKEKTYTFSTSAVQCLSARQIDANTGKSITVELDFNDRVDPAVLARYISFNQRGRNLSFNISAKTPDDSIKCTLLDVNEDIVGLTIRRGFKSANGSLGTTTTVNIPFSASYSMHVLGVAPSRWDDNAAHINSTLPIDVSSAKQFTRITPETAFDISGGYGYAELTGNFEPGKMYEIRFLPGLLSKPDKENSAISSLVEEAVFNIVFPDFAPSVGFSFNGTYLLKDASANVPVTLLNVQEMSVQVSRIYDNNIPFLLAENRWSTYDYHIKGPLVKKDVPVGAELNKPKTILLDLNELLRGIEQPRGAYEILIKAGSMPLNNYYHNSPFTLYRDKIVVVSDIGITAKKYGNSVFVWLNTISSAQPIAGADVTILSKSNQALAKKNTDQNGVVIFENLDIRDDLQPDIILAQKENDFTFIDFQAKILSVSEFDTGGRPSLTKGYEAFVFCDRDLYRPGEKVHLKSIVRGPKTSTPDRFPVILEINRPGNVLLYSGQLLLSGLGTIEHDFDIPDSALTGRYHVSIKIPGDERPVGSYSFLVQEFVPDTVKVSVSCENKAFIPGERVKAGVNAKYYFGKPASKQPAKLEVFLEPADFACENYKNYNFSSGHDINEDRKPLQAFFTASGQTDENGTAAFEFKIPENLLPASMLKLRMEASVTPQAARAVTIRESRIVNPYPYYMGIKELTDSASTGRSFAVAAVSPDGSACTENTIFDVTLFKVDYYYVFEKKSGGNYDYKYHKTCTQIDSAKLTWTSGTQWLVFETDKIKKPGDYSIKVSAPVTRHSAAIGFYKDYGYCNVFEKQNEPYYLKLEFDKKEYRAGETAVIKLPTPFKGKALMTVEREKILAHEILDISGATTEIRVEVKPEYSPNVYISLHAILPVKSDANMGFFRAYGIARLNVNTDKNTLDFSVRAPDTVRPGEKLEVKIQAGPDDIKCEFTIAVVDEGVCVLTAYKTPNPKQFFYGAKKLGIDTADIYSYLMPDLDEKQLKEKQKSGGDDGGWAEEVPEELLNFTMPVRNARKMTAFYQDKLVPGQDGLVSAYFDMPEFSGELRVMAVAIGADKFSAKELHVKVKGPITVQPVMPLTLTQGDAAEIPVAVFNNTDGQKDVVVALTSNQWLKITGPTEQHITLQAQKEDVMYFSVQASGTGETGTLDLAVSAEDFFQKLHYEIPVRPPNPFITASGAGCIAIAENSGNTTTHIDLFSDWVKGSAEYSITFSPVPGLRYQAALEYLKLYPYGCVEQTASQCFALLYYKELKNALGGQENSGKIDAMVYSGIDRLWMMQTGYNGGLSMWPGGGTAYPWGSVYAAHFLVEAKKKGYRVNENNFNRLISYLRESAYDVSTAEEYAVSAYTLYVLALNGEKNLSGRINTMRTNKGILQPSESRLLALACLYSGNKDAAMSELGIYHRATKTAFSETNGNLLSSVKENSLLLMALVDTSPDDQLIPQLIETIELEMQNGYWGNTQNTAFAVMALGKTAYLYEKLQSEYDVSIKSAGREIAVFSEKDTITLDGNKLPNPAIELNARGRGFLFYTWKASGIPAGPIKETDGSMKIRRRFLDADGKDADLNRLKAGQLLMVKLDISADSNIDNIVIVDMLPSGMEIENPAFETRARSSNGSNGNYTFMPQACQIRDDRLILFGSAGSHLQTYTYLARAVIPGEYYLPPVSAECMYTIEYKSINGAGKVLIMK
ncbi:MAG: hypothetical protein HZA48_11155 [Planctomycetes bacterium]|nr:hypothetical protein [Planctomycetota bacterium]